MTSRIIRHHYPFRPNRGVRLLEELSERGIDTEKLTLFVLLDALGAAELSLEQKNFQPWIGPFREPWCSQFIGLTDDNEDEDDS